VIPGIILLRNIDDPGFLVVSKIAELEILRSWCVDALVTIYIENVVVSSKYMRDCELGIEKMANVIGVDLEKKGQLILETGTSQVMG